MEKYKGLITIIFASIVGFISGVWGAFVVEEIYLGSPLYYNREVITNNLSGDSEALIFKDSSKELEDVSIDSVKKSVIGIARAKKASSVIADSYYLPQDIIAHGFVLTDDGWVVTFSSDLDKEITSELVVLSGGKVFSFKDKILDPSTGVLFLKVEVDANKLTPIKIGSSEKMKILDDLISVDLFGNTVRHWLVSLDSFDNLVQSSEVLGRKMTVSGEAESGSPLINSESEVVGIVDNLAGGVTRAIPIDYFKDRIADVLKNKMIERVYFGVNYIDLSEFPQDGKMLNGVSGERGALVYASQINKAVIAGSPAAKSGILYKDIIISIEGEDLGINKNLSEIIQEYKIGSEVAVEVLRNNERVKTKLILDKIR